MISRIAEVITAARVLDTLEWVRTALLLSHGTDLFPLGIPCEGTATSRLC